MEELEETGALLDGILAVVHPALFQNARAAKAKLLKRMGYPDPLVKDWPTHYHGVHLIVNRETLFHRATSGKPGWLGMLITLGTYGESAVLSLRNLGVSVPYDAGTIALVSDWVVVRGVGPVEDGTDRICYSWAMNEPICESYRIEFDDWAKYTPLDTIAES